MHVAYTSIQKRELRQLREFARAPHTPIELFIEDEHAGHHPHAHNFWEVFLFHGTSDGPIERVSITPPGILHACRQSVIGQNTLFFEIGGIEFRCSANFDRAVPVNAVPMVKVLQTHLLLLQKTVEILPAEQARQLLEQHVRSLGEEMALVYEQTLAVKDTAFKHQSPKHAVGYLVKQSLQHDCTIAGIASSLGVSATNISRIFKRQYGCSARHVLIICRLRVACEKLVSEGMNASISSIAMATGWNSPKYFKQVFKRVLGMTPRQFAERHHEKPFSIPEKLLFHNASGMF